MGDVYVDASIVARRRATACFLVATGATHTIVSLLVAFAPHRRGGSATVARAADATP